MRNILSILMMCLFALAFSACTKKGCKRICECLEEEYADINENECLEDCVDDAKDEGRNCKKTVRDLGRCLDKGNCDWNDCESEADDFLDDCDWD